VEKEIYRDVQFFHGALQLSTPFLTFMYFEMLLFHVVCCYLICMCIMTPLLVVMSGVQDTPDKLV